MHSNLNFHPAEARTARIDSHTRLEELATVALKHIPGSAKLIEKHFSTAGIEPELKEEKPINLVMYHTPHR